jgi:hypothetical protein
MREGVSFLWDIQVDQGGNISVLGNENGAMGYPYQILVCTRVALSICRLFSRYKVAVYPIDADSISLDSTFCDI